MNYKQILLLSGMDSYIAWHYTGKPRTLYCSLGHKYEQNEVKWIKELVPDTIIDNTLHLGNWEHEDAFIPLRNMFLVSVGALYADEVILTVQKGELTLPDRSLYFMDEFGKMLSYLKEASIRIYSPFIELTKVDLVKWYVTKGLNIENLKKTVSCYTGHDIPCGRCNACFRRWISFTLNGIEEEYENNILDWSGIEVYLDKVKRGEYIEERRYEIINALDIVNYSYPKGKVCL